MGARLYEITGALADLHARAEAGEDVSEALALVEGDLEAKGMGIVHVARELEADEVACAVEIERLTERRDRFRKQRERLLAYVLDTMVASGVRKIQAPTLTLAVVENPPKVVIVDESAIPDEYMRTPEPPPLPKPVPDKKAIADAYKKHGEIIAGTIVERGMRLKIT